MPSSHRPLLLAFLLLAAAAAHAHHAFDSEFDRDKPVVLTGTVTRIEWTNPHVSIHVVVKAGDGKVIGWRVQAAPPGVLIVNGLTHETLRPGMAIRIEGFAAKLDIPVVHGTLVTRADGRIWCVNVPCRFSQS
jgi:hypothetical protein